LSKLRPDNINFDETDFVVVESCKNEESKQKMPEIEEPPEVESGPDEAELILNRAREQADEIVKNAQKEAENILNKASFETEAEKEKTINEAKESAQQILNAAAEDAKNLTDATKKETQELLDSSKDEIEKMRIAAINEGYSEGYKDAGEKIQEELEEKIKKFDDFIKTQFEAKDKIIKSASKDILDITMNIARKILHQNLDAKMLDSIIKSTIALFEKKENINILLSEKYARLLYELQKKSLTEDVEFSFEQFKQYDNFQIVYNPKIDDDTIIIENPKERFDASIDAQMDVIVRNIFEGTQNGKIDSLEQYIEEKADES